MLDEFNNKRIYNGEIVNPLETINIADNGSSQCKRPVGAGYYDVDTNKTVTCYSGPGMDIYLSEYNHSTKKQEPAYCIHENNMYGRWDYHNYANLIKAPDGQMIVFFVNHTKEMYMLKSPDWEKVIISKDFNSYPSPVVAGNDIYIFYSRHDNEVSGVKMHPYRSLWYVKSSDSGISWSEAVNAIDSDKQSPREIDEVYLVGCNYYKENYIHPNRIQLDWTMWGGINGHATSNDAVYSCYLSLDNMKLYSPSAKLIGDTIDHKNMIDNCQVYLTPEYNNEEIIMASVLSSVLDNGHIIAVYGVISENGVSSVRSAECVGDKWIEIIISENTYSVKDIYKCNLTGRVKIVYAKGDYLIISEYNDECKTWEAVHTTKIKFINGASSVQYANFILDHKAEFQVVIGQNGEKIEDLYKGIWPITGYGKET